MSDCILPFPVANRLTVFVTGMVKCPEDFLTSGAHGHTGREYAPIGIHGNIVSSVSATRNLWSLSLSEQEHTTEVGHRTSTPA